MATSTHTADVLVCREFKQPLTLEKVQIEPLHPDEALIDIHATGVCHTDVVCMNGEFPHMKLPAVFGHEGGGVVLETGANVQGLSPGDKVLLSFSHCRSCEQCDEGHPSYCDNFVDWNFLCTRPDGTASMKDDKGNPISGSFFGQSSFASKAVVHKNSIVKVPADTPLDLFSPLGCGQITGAGTVFNALDVKEGETIAVFGCGGVGLAAVMAAKIRKAKTILAVDLFENRLTLAKEVGATHVVGADIAKDPEKLMAHFHEVCPPKGVHHAIDTTGVGSVISTMVRCLRSRGTAVSLGASQSEASINPLEHLFAGRNYMGVTEGNSVPEKIIPYLIEEWKKGNYPIEKLITYYPVADYQKALDDAHAGTTIKPVLRWK